MPPRQPLPPAFYDRDVVVVARALLGTRLVREWAGQRTVGRIVEVEAYLARGDSANHASRGRTPRNAAMFAAPGRAYVYSIHARFCLNAVTETRGVASAVLLRAVEPLEGLAAMRRRRGRDAVLELARGPARLCEAFAVDKAFDGWDLSRGAELWIESDAPAAAPAVIEATPRIGVTSARDLPLRFVLDGSRFASRPVRRRA